MTQISVTHIQWLYGDQSAYQHCFHFITRRVMSGLQDPALDWRRTVWANGGYPELSSGNLGDFRKADGLAGAADRPGPVP